MATELRGRPSGQPLEENRSMKQVLFVGQVPETVDFSDPALPPGFDAAKIHAGIAVGMRQIADRGWHGDLCLVPPDASAADTLRRQLATAPYDCVVLGGGIRIPPKSLLFFEKLVNVVREESPSASIAFNTRPEDNGEAAARWMKPEQG
jgi:hypothetical protein